jgi:hypothetical protein
MLATEMELSSAMNALAEGARNAQNADTTPTAKNVAAAARLTAKNAAGPDI